VKGPTTEPGPFILAAVALAAPLERRPTVRAILLVSLVTGCAPSLPRYPPFHGQETDAWIAYEVPVGRDPSDLLPAFEASARSHGCSTHQIGRDAETTVAGELRFFYGVTATCDEGTIALVTLAGGRVRVGCAKPSTRERCDFLLQEISEAR
jgi:hypothetical protein